METLNEFPINTAELDDSSLTEKTVLHPDTLIYGLDKSAAAVAAGEEDVRVRAKNFYQSITQVKNYADIDYNCSRDPDTDVTVEFRALIEAALASPEADTEEGAVINFAPGVINLTGTNVPVGSPQLKLPITILNKKLRVRLHPDTRFVVGKYINGTSTFPIPGASNAEIRTIFRIGKEADFEFCGGIMDGSGFIAECLTDVYATGADWGARVKKIHIHNVKGVNCFRGPLRVEHDNEVTGSGKEQPEREATIFVSSSVIGDGAVNSFIASAALPTNTLGQQKLAAGRVLACETAKFNDRIRSFDLVISGLNTGTNQVTFQPPLPLGVNLLGPISATATESVTNSLTCTFDNVTNMFEGRHVPINGNSKQITKIDGMAVHFDSWVTTTSGTTTIIANGSQCVLKFDPAVVYENVDVHDLDYEVLTYNDTGARLMRLGNESYIAFKKVTFRDSEIHGCQQWITNFGSTYPQATDHCDYLEISNIRSYGFMHREGSSGAGHQSQGFKESVRLNNYFYDSKPLNHLELKTKDSTIVGKNFIRVEEDLRNLDLKFGYTIDNETGEKVPFVLSVSDVADGTATTTTASAAEGANSITVALTSGYAVNSLLAFPCTPSSTGVLATRVGVVSTHAGGVVTFKDPLPGAVASGAAVVHKFADSAGVQPQSHDTRAAGWRFLLQTPNGQEYGFSRAGFMLAVVSDGPVGTHEIWFDGTGHGVITPAGAKLFLGDINLMSTNGQELDYNKDRHFVMDNYRVDRCHGHFQALITCKAGPAGAGLGHDTLFPEKYVIRNSYFSCLLKQMGFDRTEGTAIFCQADNVTITGNTFDSFPGTIGIHNLTVVDGLRFNFNKIFNVYFTDGIRGSCWGGYDWNFDCNDITVKPSHFIDNSSGGHSLIGFYYTNANTNTSNFNYRSQFKKYSASSGTADTTKLLNKRIQNLFHRPKYHGIFNMNTAEGSTNLVEDFTVGGTLKTDIYSFLMLGGSNTGQSTQGRIGRVKISRDTNLLNCYTPIQDVICRRPQFNGPPNNIPIELTVSNTVSSGKEITIPLAHSRNIPKGSPVWVILDTNIGTTVANWGGSGQNSISLGSLTNINRGSIIEDSNGHMYILYDLVNSSSRNYRTHKNVPTALVSSSNINIKGVLKTWTTEDSDFTGTLKLFHDIPSTVTAGNKIFILPVHPLILEDPRSLKTPFCEGYASDHLINVAAGQSSVVLPLRGRWPTSRHLIWGPRPEHLDIKAIDGDLNSVTFGAPTIVDNSFQTNVTSSASEGATQLIVANRTGFRKDDWVEVSLDNYQIHQTKITGITAGSGDAGTLDIDYAIPTGRSVANNNTVRAWNAGGSVTWALGGALSSATTFRIKIYADELIWQL